MSCQRSASHSLSSFLYSVGSCTTPLNCSLRTTKDKCGPKALRGSLETNSLSEVLRAYIGFSGKTHSIRAHGRDSVIDKREPFSTLVEGSRGDFGALSPNSVPPPLNLKVRLFPNLTASRCFEPISKPSPCPPSFPDPDLS